MPHDIELAQEVIFNAGNKLVEAKLRLKGTSYEKSIGRIMKEIHSLNDRLCSKIRKERDKDKKMTISYWNSLSRSSKERALKYCFPIHNSIVEMLLDEKPNHVTSKDSFWYTVFSKVRIPVNSSYKTKIGDTYLM